jgi:hypothetical protein
VNIAKSASLLLLISGSVEFEASLTQSMQSDVDRYTLCGDQKQRGASLLIGESPLTESIVFLGENLQRDGYKLQVPGVLEGCWIV